MMWSWNIFVQKNVHHNVLKNTNIFKKIFLIFMKFRISTKYYDSIWLNRFVTHVKSLMIIISQMIFFKVMIISMWLNKILRNNHFQMKMTKNVMWAIFLILISNVVCLTNSN
jgi:hypothetical protein